MEVLYPNSRHHQLVQRAAEVERRWAGTIFGRGPVRVGPAPRLRARPIAPSQSPAHMNEYAGLNGLVLSG